MLHLVAFYALLLGACAYALWRGGAPERAVAAIMLVGVAATRLTLSSPSIRYRDVETTTMVMDILVLAGFLAVAMRADRRWPMAIAALHGLSVAAHAARSVSPEMIRTVYKTIMVVWVYPQLLLLVLGVMAHQRRMTAKGADPSWSRFSPRS